MSLPRSRPSLLVLVALTILPSLAAAQAELDTEEKKTLYALGLALSQQVRNLGLSVEELETVQLGLVDGATGREPKVDPQAYMSQIQDFAKLRVSRAAAAEKTVAAAFLAEKAAAPGAIEKESGLVIREITPGTGASPKATDKVTVHYHGTLRDGTVFDSSVKRGQPATFALTQVIRCWTEGLQLMKVGGKSELVCPSDIAYGDQGRPGIPPAAALVFEVELLSVESP